MPYSFDVLTHSEMDEILTPQHGSEPMEITPEIAEEMGALDAVSDANTINESSLSRCPFSFPDLIEAWFHGYTEAFLFLRRCCWQ